MKLTRKTNSDGTITLSWEKIPGVDGYRFYSAGVFRSDTWDANRTSVKFSGGQEPYVVEAIVATAWTVKDTGQYPPSTTPPPPVKRYAPRTHNLGGRDQDPRFCCKPEYGVKLEGGVYVDEMGCTYDTDKMMNGDGKRDRAFIVEGLKGADSMDGAEPCDPYVGPTGTAVPPYPGDPAAQTGSFHR